MGRWATRRWTVRALRAAPVWCGHVATFPQGPKSARHLVPIVGQRGSFVPAARGRQRSARRERGVKITGVNVGGADMVCQARFFLCVHGAHAVAAERPITHKPSTRWLRAAVGLRFLTCCTVTSNVHPSAPPAHRQRTASAPPAHRQAPPAHRQRTAGAPPAQRTASALRALQRSAQARLAAEQSAGPLPFLASPARLCP